MNWGQLPEAETGQGERHAPLARSIFGYGFANGMPSDAAEAPPQENM